MLSYIRLVSYLHSCVDIMESLVVFLLGTLDIFGHRRPLGGHVHALSAQEDIEHHQIEQLVGIWCDV